MNTTKTNNKLYILRTELKLMTLESKILNKTVKLRSVALLFLPTLLLLPITAQGTELAVLVAMLLIVFHIFYEDLERYLTEQFLLHEIPRYTKHLIGYVKNQTKYITLSSKDKEYWHSCYNNYLSDGSSRYDSIDSNTDRDI